MTRQFLLMTPRHDQHLLPVPKKTSANCSVVFSPVLSPSFSARNSVSKAAGRVLQSVFEARKDSQIVVDFRNKLRLAEDLISKLAFNLQEIQGARRRTKATEQGRGKAAKILSVLR